MSKTNPNDTAYPHIYEQYKSDGSVSQFNAVVGLIKRELFAMHAPRFDEDCSAKYAGAVVGIAPPGDKASFEEWGLFWRRVNARYQVMFADALIEALNDIEVNHD